MRHSWTTPALLSALIAGIGACSLSDGGAGPEPKPAFLGATILPNAHNTVSAVAEVRALLWDSAFARFWRDGEPPRRSPSYGFGQDTIVRIPILGLDTMATYAVELNLVLGDTLVAVADTGTFTSGALPAWIPHAVATGSDTTPGYLTLSYPDGPVIVDNTGKVVWYRSSPNRALDSFQAHANGQYTVLALDDATDSFLVLDELGNAVGTLEYRFRLRRLRPPPERAHRDRGGLHAWQRHCLDGHGNLLLSFRSLNEVTKVDVTTGQILWRFGGIRNEFTFVNDAKGPPPRLPQTDPDPRQRPAGPKPVRALLAQSRRTNGPAHGGVLRRPHHVHFRRGATQYYASGRGLVTFGRAGRVVEFDEAGNRAWELTGIQGTYVFRAQRIASLYAPERMGR